MSTRTHPTHTPPPQVASAHDSGDAIDDPFDQADEESLPPLPTWDDPFMSLEERMADLVEIGCDLSWVLDALDHGQGSLAVAELSRLPDGLDDEDPDEASILLNELELPDVLSGNDSPVSPWELVNVVDRWTRHGGCVNGARQLDNLR